MQVSNQPITNRRPDQALDLRQGHVQKEIEQENRLDSHSVNLHRQELERRVDTHSQQAERQRSSQTAELENLLRQRGAGNNPSPELKQAARILLDKGMPLTEETIQELKTFLTRENGSTKEKLETIEALANRRLPITQTFLRPVHEALHGRNLAENLAALSKRLETELTKPQHAGLVDRTGLNARELASEARQAVITQREARGLTARILQQYMSSQSGEASHGELARALEGRQQGQIFGQTVSSQGSANQGLAPQEASRAIQEAVAFIKREANLNRVIEHVRTQVVNNPAVSREVAVQVERALNETAQLQQQGRELAARGQLAQTLTQALNQTAEQEQAISGRPAHAPVASAPVEQSQQQYIHNELFQTSQELNTKDLIVTRITQKLAEAAQTFTTVKREISRVLDQATRLLQQLRHHAVPQVQQMLSSTIDKLDKAILKSEMTMLTDMKTEKQLMQASSQLAEAKRLLAKGDLAGAQKIVQDVKTMLDKLRWQPSETRVQHFLLKESQAHDPQRPVQQLFNQLEQGIRPFMQQEPSARTMFEFLRTLGLNHDGEAVRSLMELQHGGQQDTANRHENVKATLLQLLRAEAEQGRINQQSEQALNNILGQQLLSKHDPGSTSQHLLFNLPFQLGENLHNLQVIVNGRQEGEKLDWENCNIYFLIETRKLGEVGILLTASERNLSITIKNNSPGFKEKMEPLVEECKANLQEIGYHVTGIQFARLDTKQEETKAEPQNILTQVNIDPNKIPKTTLTAKGFDFKI